ncbi:hypothetical protein DFH08DRAFT_958469 [Mycena albidolilacea]|uniref:Uncharacterized protein n=1 Tax=Mycena albidolilacea TaxID=1033008 RepID=A0AAD7A720_9AGAR|nr:hypothetical protein DFH08DRAFT_958465 [Mycena albidolilacea]KAJ7350849.1 hypothetical protein DFH08DRAFT_958469 [Mycena albidolilacea]
MTPLDLPLPPATVEAVRQSANQASDLVAEADREHAATWDASLRHLEQEWVDNGWGESSESFPSAAQELTREWAYMCAHNAFHQYLKHLHELIHLPFFYPTHSGLATWGTPSTWEASTAHDLLVAVLKHIHELVHPPFTHPEFPEDPAITIWKANGLFIGRWDSSTLWGRDAADLTEVDDEISPIQVTVPLPFEGVQLAHEQAQGAVRLAYEQGQAIIWPVETPVWPVEAGTHALNGATAQAQASVKVVEIPLAMGAHRHLHDHDIART